MARTRSRRSCSRTHSQIVNAHRQPADSRNTQRQSETPELCSVRYFQCFCGEQLPLSVAQFKCGQSRVKNRLTSLSNNLVGGEDAATARTTKAANLEDDIPCIPSGALGHGQEIACCHGYHSGPCGRLQRFVTS